MGSYFGPLECSQILFSSFTQPLCGQGMANNDILFFTYPVSSIVLCCHFDCTGGSSSKPQHFFLLFFFLNLANIFSILKYAPNLSNNLCLRTKISASTARETSPLWSFLFLSEFFQMVLSVVKKSFSAWRLDIFLQSQILKLWKHPAECCTSMWPPICIGDIKQLITG